MAQFANGANVKSRQWAPISKLYQIGADRASMATRLQLVKPRFKLATFDVTNTLLKFHKTVGNAYADIGMLYGVKCDPQKVDSAFRVHWKHMRELYPNYGKSSGMSTRAWWGELVRRTFHDTQPSITKEQLQAISKDLFERYTTGECWKVCSGAFNLLDALKQHSVMLGIISNFDERLDPVLTATGLRPYFEFVIASYFVGCEKPDPKIFQLALNQACNMNVRAFEAVHVGDDYFLDYMGAKNAGWHALLFQPWEKDSRHKPVGNSREIIRDMDEIHQHVFQK